MDFVINNIEDYINMKLNLFFRRIKMPFFHSQFLPATPSILLHFFWENSGEALFYYSPVVIS